MNESIQRQSLRERPSAMDFEQQRKKFLDIYLGEHGWIAQIGLSSL